jgi:Holliday junction DNA helicase RuvA
MIASIRGVLLESHADRVVLEAGGIGYEIHISPSTANRMPNIGSETQLFVFESTPMYGGGTVLYGFLSREDKQMFLTFKELPSTGAKKAIEHLEKASRSLPDFRRAILDADAKVLTGMFRFTKKTAQKLIAGLKDKLGGDAAPVHARPDDGAPAAGPLGRAMEALEALGYKMNESRSALEAVKSDLGSREASVEEIIKLALRKL